MVPVAAVHLGPRFRGDDVNFLAPLRPMGTTSQLFTVEA